MVDIDSNHCHNPYDAQAWTDGIGSCWITWFDPEIIRQEFSLPEEVIPVNILVLGYADEEKRLKRKAQIAMNKNVSRSRIWYGAKSYHVLLS